MLTKEIAKLLQFKIDNEGYRERVVLANTERLELVSASMVLTGDLEDEY